MEPVLLDANFQKNAILDTFESLIWTDKYYGCGDFEIVGPITSKAIHDISISPYLSLRESEHLMVVEDFNIQTDVTAGNRLIIKGRSVESILDRRIIWVKAVLKDNFQEGIQLLLDENVINPTIPERAIPNFEFEASTDPAITSLTIDEQYDGVDLYKTILDLCLSRGIGFKITLTDNAKLQFKLYSGVDRSYDQVVVPYVIFSPKYDNTLKGDYIYSDLLLKTVALVGGEMGIANLKKTASVECPTGGGSGLLRREIFIDAHDISKNVPAKGNNPAKTLSHDEYIALLVQRGKEELAKHVTTQAFEGQIDATRMFTYGKDFFMGDIVQVTNEYGNEAMSRVTELIHSQDPSGTRIYPTFSTLTYTA